MVYLLQLLQSLPLHTDLNPADTQLEALLLDHQGLVRSSVHKGHQGLQDHQAQQDHLPDFAL
eukprot:NODE_8102_length_298_cov_79.562249_g7363_i0.p2 GENE.NODE_8102_length_298_cov_79.562249_g7363_i0~~NODE_8102_length_298_cov_79.562249_g7363_i0.p2  ORF type:complete len:62 (-),score=9.30 NODE_8102_length_298_cov_79.562249_g7363_i0:65-250(-)